LKKSARERTSTRRPPEPRHATTHLHRLHHQIDTFLSAQGNATQGVALLHFGRMGSVAIQLEGAMDTAESEEAVGVE